MIEVRLRQIAAGIRVLRHHLARLFPRVGCLAVVHPVIIQAAQQILCFAALYIQRGNILQPVGEAVAHIAVHQRLARKARNVRQHQHALAMTHPQATNRLVRKPRAFKLQRRIQAILGTIQNVVFHRAAFHKVQCKARGGVLRHFVQDAANGVDIARQVAQQHARAIVAGIGDKAFVQFAHGLVNIAARRVDARHFVQCGGTPRILPRRVGKLAVSLVHVSKQPVQPSQQIQRFHVAGVIVAHPNALGGGSQVLLGVFIIGAFNEQTTHFQIAAVILRITAQRLHKVSLGLIGVMLILDKMRAVQVELLNAGNILGTRRNRARLDRLTMTKLNRLIGNKLPSAVV